MNRLRQRILSLILMAAYILGNQRGYIALWESGDPEPRQIFPYKVESLPEADQKALAEGIRLKDAGELMQLLEDYLS